MRVWLSDDTLAIVAVACAVAAHLLERLSERLMP